MKKLIALLAIASMLLVSTNTVLAADDNNLDIEKVAIQSIKNSQNVQSIDRQVAELKKNYSDVTATVNMLRGTLENLSSYQIVEQVILLPLSTKNMLSYVNNEQMVVTNATRLSAYSAYIGLLKANYSLNIRQDLMNSLEADYKKAQMQQTLGLLSPSQLRLSEIAYLKAQYQYNSAQNSYNSASIAVNNLMGEDLAKQFTELQDYNIVPAAQIKSLTDYVALASTNRADIINAQNTLDTKKQQYLYGMSEIPSDFQFYCQQQQYAIDNAQNSLDLKKVAVQQNITSLYSSLSGAMKNLEAMKDLEDQAVLAYQAAETEYKNSQISLLDFDNAKIAKAQADMNYKNAQLDAWLMQTTMDSACGIGYVPDMSGLSSSQSTHKNNLNPVEPNHGDN